MNNENAAPDWAPDDCPSDVVELVDVDNQLNALGLRGLASADSKEIRTGYRRLTAQLRANYLRGRRYGLVAGLLGGAVLGVLISLGLA